MKKYNALTVASFLTLSLAGKAYASCDVKAEGTYNFVSNSQPTFIDFSKELGNCKDVNVDWKILVDNKGATYQGISVPKSPLAGIVLSNAQFGEYNAEGLIMPITKIVEKYKSQYPGLTDDMLIKVNGEVYAIAIVSNLQHFAYRIDLFEKYGLEVPKTYDELFKILDVIKEKGDVQYPYGAPFKSGWNLGTEYFNLYLSTGKPFFKAGTSIPAINNEDSRRALKTLKKLYSYASPNSLALASGDVVGLFQNGSVGVMQMWASRANAADDKKLSQVSGKVGFASALKLSANDPRVVSSLFWDGFAIPKNTQADPEVTFKLFMELIDKETVVKNNDNAIWISKYATPSKYAKGLVETRKNSVAIFPSTPQASLLQSIFGKYLGDFLSGNIDADKLLKKVEDEYTKVAKEKGLLE